MPTLDEAHIWTDSGISGGEFKDRPGLSAMLDAAKAKTFDVLVTMDPDRIGRDQRSTQGILHDLIEAGIRVFYYASGEELKLDTPVAEFMSAAKNFGNQWYRHSIQVKTKSALRKKVADGFCAGTRLLGYDNVRAAEGGAVTRVVNENEAALVRMIFTMVAEGRGLLKTAKALNAKQIPNPTGQDRGATKTAAGQKRKGHAAGFWASTGIRGVLYNETYRGVTVYGKTKWIDRGGTKKKVAVPEAEWLRVPAPHLRIVSDELWNAAHARLARTRAAYARNNLGRINGKPEAGLDSAYLLSGLLVCGACGGRMSVAKRGGAAYVGRPMKVYVCSAHRVRGNAACGVKATLPVSAIDHAVVRGLREQLLTPERLADMVEALVASVPAGEDRDAQRRRLNADLERVEGELKRLTDAVASGAAVQSLLDAIKGREAERAGLQARVADLEAMEKPAGQGASRNAVREVFKLMLDVWGMDLAKHPAAGRRHLRQILTGPIVVRRREDGLWTYEARRTMGGVIRRTLGKDGSLWAPVEAAPDEDDAEFITAPTADTAARGSRASSARRGPSAGCDAPA